MKVLLIKDVYKLGRAGDIKKVADGYGRNFLVPQGLALPATGNSMKLAKTIGKKADEQRAILNKELQGLADIIAGLTLNFAVKAGETGKLYGSVSTQMIVDKVKEQAEIEIGRHQINIEPIRNLGEYLVPVNLTIDLVPEMTVVIRREGEAVKAPAARYDVEEVAVALEETDVELAEELSEVVEEVEEMVEEVMEEIIDEIESEDEK